MNELSRFYWHLTRISSNTRVSVIEMRWEMTLNDHIRGSNVQVWAAVSSHTEREVCEGCVRPWSPTAASLAVPTPHTTPTIYLCMVGIWSCFMCVYTCGNSYGHRKQTWCCSLEILRPFPIGDCTNLTGKICTYIPNITLFSFPGLAWSCSLSTNNL